MPERGTWQPQWIPIASQFPASLATDQAPEKLSDGFSPSAYGMGVDKPGYLYLESSVPTGTVWNGIATATAPTNAPETATWRLAHNRLFGFATTGTTLWYSAYGYDSNYLIQDLGYIPVDHQESADIIQVVPFGNSIAIFKTDCLYVIKNADNPSGNFVAEYVRQGSGLPVAGNVIAIDNSVYWVNTTGVFGYDGNKITEFTMPIHDNLGAFASGQVTTLTADFVKKDIIGLNSATTKFIITTGDNPALYDYSTAGFRFTTRTLTGAEGEPMLVDKVGFIYQYSAGEQATIDLDVKINDSWKTESQLKVRPANDNGRCEIGLANALACRKFALRVTNMSVNLYISRILVHVKQGGVLGYSNK